MSMILVSVIIPVYNVESYLREALDSVINQTYKNLDIIVINDGSTDESGMICDEYALKDSRIRVIHQKNMGLSAARNAGLDAMRGDLVVFLDSDDAYLPDFVKSLVEIQIQEEADIVVCRYTFYKKNDRLNFNNIKVNKHTKAQYSLGRTEALRALVRNEINFGVWNKIYRCELWNDLRFPVGHVYEDIATTYVVINLSNKIAVIDNALYIYRQRAGSITHTNTWKHLSDRVLAYSHLDRLVETNTPTIFSTKDLYHRLQTSLNSNMSLYIRYKDKNDTAAVELRNRLIQRGLEIGPNKLSFRSKIAFFVFCYCPIILRIAYPIYAPLRHLVYRTTGK